MTTATAQSHPNIAFIKYWGNRDNTLRLPMNGSISMNLDGLYTRTTVSFQPSLPFDELIINGYEVTGAGLERVSFILDIVRGMANITERAEVITENNFPSGAGIASSASAFAALALAGSKAAGLNLSERELSRLARRGSGSASRSIPSGFVEWQAGTSDEDSFAFSIAAKVQSRHNRGGHDFGVTHSALRVFGMMQTLQKIITQTINDYNLCVHGVSSLSLYGVVTYNCSRNPVDFNLVLCQA